MKNVELDFNNIEINSDMSTVVITVGNVVQRSNKGFLINCKGDVSEVKAGCFCTSLSKSGKGDETIISGSIKMPSVRAITPKEKSVSVYVYWKDGKNTKVIFKSNVHNNEDTISNKL